MNTNDLGKPNRFGIMLERKRWYLLVHCAIYTALEVYPKKEFVNTWVKIFPANTLSYLITVGDKGICILTYD